MNQYRCETCKTPCPYNFDKSDDDRDFTFDERIRYGNIRLHTRQKGCASHSDHRCIPISNNKMCEMCSKNERADERQKMISALIERTKNFGEIKHPDGSMTIQMKLCVEGSVRNAISSAGDWRYKDGFDSWGIKEFCRLYHEGRKAWLEGDLDTVADMFGILV